MNPESFGTPQSIVHSPDMTWFKTNPDKNRVGEGGGLNLLNDDNARFTIVTLKPLSY